MMNHSQLLLAIVEDELALRENLIDFFALKGMRALGFESAEDFYVAMRAIQFDLVILDVALPGDSGIDAAKIVRRQSNVPILVLTAHHNNQTHLSSLNAGVDVFLSKLASLEVIESSVRNMLLRAQTPIKAENSLAADWSAEACWVLSLKQRLLIAPNQSYCLYTHMEVLLLNRLFIIAQQTVHRKDLLQAISKADTLSNIRNLDTYINRIRRKCFQDTGLDIPIQASYNLGYAFTGQAKLAP